MFVAREIRELELGVQKLKQNCWGRAGVNRMGIQRSTTMYNRGYENENRVQFSVGDSHRKSVVVKELGVSL
jgi:hypothetical protein